jgi:CheY-like chemotaxis protein
VRILIIEDEEHIREVAQVSLEILGGWEVLMAGGGEEGIVLAVAEQPDVILLDVMMPGLDGPETLQRLRADPRTAAIPVVFLTAKAQAAERRQLAELGAAGVLAKPFDPTTLAADVAAAVGCA